MSSRIIDRGRGPEIEGTRVTVYRIMDYVRESAPAARMVAELDLTAEQIDMALSYLAANREQLEKQYARILDRAQRQNGSAAGPLPSAEELRKRIQANHGKDLTHAASRRQ